MHDLTFCMAISYLAITSGLIWTCSRCCKTWSKPIKTILLFTLVLLLAYFPTIKLSITTIHTYNSPKASISNTGKINTRKEIGELFCNNFKLFHTHFVCFLQKNSSRCWQMYVYRPFLSQFMYVKSNYTLR